ncbi:hypothetical protein MMC07_007215 [Pseudocyphellaria aurata]|nr:hypothetical protein [Pseudocyphellaria aurata]
MSRRGYEEIDIRDRRRTVDREPEFLRDDYGRSPAGPLVVRERRESIDIESRERPRERLRETEVDREEITIARGPRERQRPREYETEEVRYRRDSRPQIARQREEYVFRPRPREPSFEREEITIQERERKYERPQKRDYKDEEIIIRKGEREKDYGEEELIIRTNEKAKIKPWEKYRTDEQERKPRPKERDYGSEKEEIVFRRGERDHGSEKEEIVFRRGERDALRPRAVSYERESITIKNEDRERPRARSRDYRNEDITIRRSEPRARSRGHRDEEITIRRDDTPESEYRREENDITIRHDEKHGRRRDEVIIRRNEKEREPSPEYVPAPLPPPPPEPEPIRAPPIHQEIITHHRHIDHGFDRPLAPSPAPPPPRPRTPPKPRSPSPKTSFEEIEIRRRGSRNGRSYDEDIVIDSRRRPARRSPSPPPRSVYSTRDELEITEEADYYNQRAVDRGYIGEGYNGATKDWAIVDVPPGTKRVQLEGVGGASQEVTWQRYNGVRRSEFHAEDEVRGTGFGEVARHEPPEDTRDRGRRFVAQKPKTDLMWTEITKDLVIKEAIEEVGYDYEETEFFFYVMEYLRYEDVLQLVEITEAHKRDRRERIREIEFERSLPRERPRKQLALPWDEEKIYEREVVYEGPRGGRYR